MGYYFMLKYTKHLSSPEWALEEMDPTQSWFSLPLPGSSHVLWHPLPKSNHKHGLCSSNDSTTSWSAVANRHQSAIAEKFNFHENTDQGFHDANQKKTGHDFESQAKKTLQLCIINVNTSIRNIFISSNDIFSDLLHKCFSVILMFLHYTTIQAFNCICAYISFKYLLLKTFIMDL